MTAQSMLLTAEQVAFRDARLVENLRQKYPQLSNYEDGDLVRAYDAWFMSQETEDEDDFLEFIAPAEET